jgi:nucleotide-binding universal stress UspA family protein
MAPPRLPVVTGVDGVRGRLATVNLAAAEARRRGADLLIAHAWPGRYVGPFRGRGGPLPTEDDARRLVEVAARRAELSEPAVRVRTTLLTGEPAGQLTQLSEEAQLLVVGHRDDVLTRHGWGSTAAYLAHHAACPLLVDRGEEHTRGPVVLAASAREPNSPTVGVAFAEADRLGAPLTAVHVWAAPPGGTGSAIPPRPTGYAAARDEADRMLAEALSGWSSQYPDVAVERLVLHDLDIAYTIDRASQRGRLLVAGAGRTRRMAELLYGSLGRALLRTSACPVLLVPPGRPAPVA